MVFCPPFVFDGIAAFLQFTNIEPTGRGTYELTRTSLRIFFMLTSFGLISLLAMLGRPAIAELRTVDTVHLIGTGMCFGGAIDALVTHLHSRLPQ